MREDTQRLKIKAALKNGERLTPIEALTRFGCFRLGARIWDLRQEGMNIVKDMVPTPGGARVAEYRLVK